MPKCLFNVPTFLTLKKFYVQPTQTVFVCFVWIWEQTAIISLYSINWLVCITETECVYCAVRTGYLNVIWVICFIWIWEQTAIISLYSVNWPVYITERESVYCAVQTGYLNIIWVNLSPCGWRHYSLAFRRWDSGSILDQTTWDLWWT